MSIPRRKSLRRLSCLLLCLSLAHFFHRMDKQRRYSCQGDRLVCHILCTNGGRVQDDPHHAPKHTDYGCREPAQLLPLPNILEEGKNAKKQNKKCGQASQETQLAPEPVVSM